MHHLYLKVWNRLLSKSTVVVILVGELVSELRKPKKHKLKDIDLKRAEHTYLASFRPATKPWYLYDMGFTMKEREYGDYHESWEDRVNPSPLVPFCYYDREWMGDQLGYLPADLSSASSTNDTLKSVYSIRLNQDAAAKYRTKKFCNTTSYIFTDQGKSRWGS